MSNDTLTLSRRRLLGSVVAVAGASAGVGAGTMAYFSDTEPSSNAVEAGTLALSFGVDGTFSFGTTIAPGTPTSDSIELVNDGSLGGSLDVDVDYTNHDESGVSDTKTAQAVAENLEVTRLKYAGTDRRNQIDTSNSPPTLHDLATNPHGTNEEPQNDLVDLPDPGSGTPFEVEFTLTNVSDDFQGQGVEVEFTFHLNQTDDQ